MIKTLTSTGIVCLAIGCLPLGACATGAKTTGIAQAPTGMHEITALYKQATEPHRKAFRKPVRDARNRAMRTLALKAEQLVIETEPWDSDARLTSVDAGERDGVRTNVAAFRNSLRHIKDAAERSNTADVRQHYAAAVASYRRLTTITGTNE